MRDVACATRVSRTFDRRQEPDALAGTSGSARGERGNPLPYRDHFFRFLLVFNGLEFSSALELRVTPRFDGRSSVCA